MQQIKSSRTTHPLGSGMTMIAAVALFALGGRWLDEKTGLGPLFLLLGFFLGALGGFIHLVASMAPELLPFTSKKSVSNESPEADTRSADLESDAESDSSKS
jgi:Putative F0F1-ATPase subunit Ca2+/Mg2+ transporter